MGKRFDFGDWLKLRFPAGCPSSFDLDDLEMAFRAGKTVNATQPQAPQGAVTDAERYQHLRNLPIEAPANGVDVAIWGDHCGESIRGEALDHLIDGEIIAKRAAPETPEVQK